MMHINLIIFISLLLDLLAFTLILPLFPSTLECYSRHDQSGLYTYFESIIYSSQQLIGNPDKFNKALLGGLLGSWFSLLQFLTMPIMGSISDSYGRRLPYLLCLLGISLSYIIWIRSEGFFSVFVLFRTLGGISKGNISLSTAIVTDVSSEEKRGKGFAMIGIAFSLGFILGPMLGAFLSSWHISTTTPSASCFQPFPPYMAFVLSLINLVFSYRYLPETLPFSKRSKSVGASLKDSLNYINPLALFSFKVVSNLKPKEKRILQLCGYVNFVYLFIYSGLEYTLMFLTYIRFNYTDVQQGKLYFFVGIIMLVIQGGFVRRIRTDLANLVCFTGILMVIPSFVIIGFSASPQTMYLGLLFYSYSSATVVPTISTFVSTIGPSDQKGVILGVFRSIGSFARAFGPITASILFWKFGIEIAYCIGSIAFLVPLCLSYRVKQMHTQHTRNDKLTN